MNDLLKLNIKAFSKTKTFKNYLVINSLLFIIIIFILCLKSYTQININEIVNNKNNRLININNFDSINTLNTFLNEASSYIEKVEYNISKYDYKINDKSYDIYTSDNNLKEDSYYIEINNLSPNQNIIINNKKINNIIYNKELSSNIILVNQKLSKYLFENNFVDEYYITLELNDYYKIDKVFKILRDFKIDANLNNNSNSEVLAYSNLNNILSVLFYIFIISIIVIIFILAITFLSDQKKNLLIYYNIGYTTFHIIKINIITNIYYLSIIFVKCSILIFVLELILLLFKINLLPYLLRTILLSVLYFHIINIFIIIIGIIYFVKIKKL